MHMCKTSATGNPQLKTKRREEAEGRAGVDIKAERERDPCNVICACPYMKQYWLYIFLLSLSLSPLLCSRKIKGNASGFFLFFLTKVPY